AAPIRRNRASRRARSAALRSVRTRSRRAPLDRPRVLTRGAGLGLGARPRAASARDLVEVVVHRLLAAFLDEAARVVGLAGAEQAERDAAPDAGFGRVADVGALGEAGAHGARTIVYAHAPDAAAVAGEADLEGEIDAARGLLVHHERQRL